MYTTKHKYLSMPGMGMSNEHDIDISHVFLFYDLYRRLVAARTEFFICHSNRYIFTKSEHLKCEKGGKKHVLFRLFFSFFVLIEHVLTGVLVPSANIHTA